MSFSYGQPPPRIDGMISLNVGNLTFRTTPDDLRRVFSKYGQVGDVYIPRDRWTKESRGFAFVRFRDRRDAEEAMDCLDGRLLDGRQLHVQMARFGRPNSPYRKGGRRGRSRSRSPRRRRRRSDSRPRRSNSRGRRSGSRSRRRRDSRSRSAPKYRSKSRSPAPRPTSARRSRSPSRSRSRDAIEKPRSIPRSRSKSNSR